MSRELLAVGALAPAFAAQADDGSHFELAALLPSGPVALYFYPGNNTPG